MITFWKGKYNKDSLCYLYNSLGTIMCKSEPKFKSQDCANCLCKEACKDIVRLRKYLKKLIDSN